MARNITHSETITTSDIVTTSNSTPVDVSRAKVIGVQSSITVNTPSAKTFADGDVNTTTDRITITSHSFVTTGLKVAATTTGTLPGGLSATNYYVIVVDADTIKLATSLANAQAGTAVDITSAAGGGTHTLTPSTLAGCTISLQKSNDYSPTGSTGTWDGATTAITTTGDVTISDIDPEYKYARLQFTLTAGKMSAVSTLIVKEDV